MTTQAEIRNWFENPWGVDNPTHMLVVCDTYDYEDYPVWVTVDQDVHKVAKKNDGPNMTRLMEVYNYNIPIEDQLAQHRAFNY